MRRGVGSARACVAIFAIALAAASATCAGEARADERTRASAATLVNEAGAAYRRGDYRHAAELFEQAHEVDPVPSLEVNAAQAWRLAGELGRAADAYAAALAIDSGPNVLRADDRAFATRKLDELRKSVATLNIDEPRGARATIGHLHDAPIPLVVHLMPGEHEVTIVKADGAVIHKTLELSAGQARTFSVVAEPASTSPVSSTPKPAATEATPQPPSAVRAPAPPSGLAPIRVAGWTSVGASVVLGGLTAYFGVRTVNAVDRWDGSTLTDMDAYDEARTFKTLTNVMLVASAATLALGVLLLVVPTHRARPAASRRVLPVVAPRF